MAFNPRHAARTQTARLPPAGVAPLRFSPRRAAEYQGVRRHGPGKAFIIAGLLSIFALSFVGCVSRNGRLYWAGGAIPPLTGKVKCVPRLALADAPPSIKVEVLDFMNLPLPGVEVMISGVGNSAQFRLTTDATGRVQWQGAAGSWRLTTSIHGFVPGEAIVSVSEDSQCSVLFELPLDDSSGEIVVT